MPNRRTSAARDWPRRARAVALAGLLAIPLVLAFASGGYFDEARLWGLLACCVVALVTGIATPSPLPRTRSGVFALAGLWALTAWTALSITWGPLRGPAFHDTQRLLLYALAFTAGIALLRERAFARATELVVAAGGAVILGYGLAGRVLPGVIHQSHGVAAGGRLDQPLTYWNAEGALAALTLVLCARLAGDGTRRVAIRVVAAAVAPAAGMALYVSYSRGALGAAVAGLLVLLAVAPDRRQLRALVLAAVLAAAGAAAAAPFPVVASLGSGSRTQGVVVLALLVAIAGAGAFTARWFALREAAEQLGSEPLRLSALRPALGVAAVLVVVAFVVATATAERQTTRNPATGATATRLTSVQSHRYAYWKVALGAFADHPLDGLGSGNFGVRWLQRRTIHEAVRDAHSLYLETAAELGLIGLAALVACGAGIALSARRALEADPVLAAGPIAAFVVWAIQTGVDWLWEMPTVSLPALLFAATLVARAASERAAARA